MHLFAYGTLRHPRIWNSVVEGSYERVDAILSGYSLRRVQHAEYPGLVENKISVVEGVVYMDVTPEDAERLDEFEGEEYIRIRVTVQTAGAESLSCQAYLYKPEYRHNLENIPWDYETFKSLDMADPS